MNDLLIVLGMLRNIQIRTEYILDRRNGVISQFQDHYSTHFLPAILVFRPV